MIPEVKKILYATDLSPNSAYALGFALQSANLYHAEMVILHVFERPVLGYAPMLDVYINEQQRQSLYNEQAEEVKDRIRKRLEVIYAKQLKKKPEYSETKYSIEVCEGYPTETILTVADDFNCDLIIMGTHGKGILANTFLGSTAKKVLRRTRKPIFIIPLPKEDLGFVFKGE
jgi:nucleotide-binding universal stress UspA family protein